LFIWVLELGYPNILVKAENCIAQEHGAWHADWKRLQDGGNEHLAILEVMAARLRED
jgi:hypothetical protein